MFYDDFNAVFLVCCSIVKCIVYDNIWATNGSSEKAFDYKHIYPVCAHIDDIGFELTNYFFLFVIHSQLKRC